MELTKKNRTVFLTAAFVLAGLGAARPSEASSHREAPFVSQNPKVDATDFYMFRSYETDRSDFVTIIANYIPLQDPYGGPNFFPMDPNALYEIHVDNNGDATEDLTFQFRFQNTLNDIALEIGTGTAARTVAIPLYNAGAINTSENSAQNIGESYTVALVSGPRRSGESVPVTLVSGGETFRKPSDFVGQKTFGDSYEAYAREHIHEITLPNCETSGRVFVGQRKDPFAVNLGQIFDLINIDAGDVTGQSSCNATSRDTLATKNVTSIVLELPIACLVPADDPVIGGWTTASVRQARVINPNATYALPSREGGPWAQVSRLGHPLVNEVVIGLRDKDRFNTSHPTEDANLFLDYVTHPTLPKLIDILFAAGSGALEPAEFPRNDLVTVFLTGVPGVTQPTSAGAVPSEQLRLNTSIDPTPSGLQDPLGVLGGDNAGFPNGRRPGDDVTDAALRVMMGALIKGAPAGSVAFTDCAPQNEAQFDSEFPYLRTPVPGSP